MGQLLDAWTAPGRPAVDQHHFTVQARENRLESRSIHERQFDAVLFYRLGF
jgi:hypothetical protein